MKRATFPPFRFEISVMLRTRWSCCGSLPAFALLVLAMSGCGNNYGTKVQQGTIEVFYKDGATKAEADRLCTYLAKTWGASGPRRSVQLKKEGDGYQFRMVVRKEFQSDSNALSRLAFDGAGSHARCSPEPRWKCTRATSI